MLEYISKYIVKPKFKLIIQSFCFFVPIPKCTSFGRPEGLPSVAKRSGGQGLVHAINKK